jgi:hypothetical protein
MNEREMAEERIAARVRELIRVVLEEERHRCACLVHYHLQGSSLAKEIIEEIENGSVA